MHKSNLTRRGRLSPTSMLWKLIKDDSFLIRTLRQGRATRIKDILLKLNSGDQSLVVPFLLQQHVVDAQVGNLLFLGPGTRKRICKENK